MLGKTPKQEASVHAHIPKGTTDALHLEPFDAALEARFAAIIRTMMSAAGSMCPTRYSEYRYILGTRGTRPLICVGINPSTAAPDALDPTLQSVERIALTNGYDSFLMFNVYAQRATRPDDMEPLCNAAAPRGKPEGLPVSALPLAGPRRLGRLGKHH